MVWRGVHEVRLVERGLKKGKNVVATRYRGSVLSKDSFGGFVGYIYTFCHCRNELLLASNEFRTVNDRILIA